MSSNMPISNSGQQPIQDRQPEKAVQGTKEDASVAQKLSMNPLHTIADLKKAELQGENIPISEEQLIKALDRAVKAVQGPATRLDFSIHEKTKKILVKVLDDESGKVIREIPPEKSLDFLAKVWEMTGILIDERR